MPHLEGDHRLNYKDIRDRVDLRDWVRSEGAAAPDRLKIMVHCPNPAHEDNSPSCRVTATGFKCYGCGVEGSVLDWVMLKYSYGDLYTAAEHIAKNINLPAAAPTVKAPQKLPTIALTLADPHLEQLVNTFNSAIGGHTMAEAAQYLRGRGFTDMTALAAAGVGYSYRFKRIIFPVFHWRDGQRVTLNYHGRSVLSAEALKEAGQFTDAEMEELKTLSADERRKREAFKGMAALRYRQYSSARPITAFMAGTTPLDSPDRLLAVEGQFDAASAAELGFAGWASCGAGRIQPIEVTLDLYPDYRPNTVVLCPDNDPIKEGKINVGAHFSDQVAEIFARKRPQTRVAMIHPPTGCKDVNDWLKADRNGLATALANA